LWKNALSCKTFLTEVYTSPIFFSPAQPYRSLYGPGPAQPTATDPSLVRPVFSLP